MNRRLPFTAKILVLLTLVYLAFGTMPLGARACGSSQSACEECCDAARAACEAAGKGYRGGCSWEAAPPGGGVGACSEGGCYGEPLEN